MLGSSPSCKTRSDTVCIGYLTIVVTLLIVLESNSNSYSSRCNKTIVLATSLLGISVKRLDLQQHV